MTYSERAAGLSPGKLTRACVKMPKLLRMGLASVNHKMRAISPCVSIQLRLWCVGASVGGLAPLGWCTEKIESECLRNFLRH